ncbi:MAG: SPFH domain-containing protein [Oscillospiraceae bacterium]|nr:SPFH domain-containing protein [Oscillospiraceae bacterium]MDD7280062.1 SPFH domain-containing protein [Oscillospiraceae bacterium]MDY2863651.1 SPFH domain-containing protein [Oscillospiraceae bacterium]
MGIFNKKNGGLTDVIRCDEPSYLIWKWHPKGSLIGNNNRESAIRWGSSLRVKDGEVAVFVYKQENGNIQDFIVGPYDKTIETENFPVLASIVGLAYAGGTPFQAEIYFINLARIIQVRFAVPFFDVYDPRFTDFSVPVAVRGTISFGITDYREFIKLHRLSSFDLDDFQRQIRDAVSRYVKDVVSNAPAANDMPVIQLESKISKINDEIEYVIGARLKETFGVTVTGVDIGAIEIDKTSDGYSKLMAVTQKMTTSTVEAQTAAAIKNIHDKQCIEAENYAETLRMQREEAQYAQHKQTQTANFAAYQTEAQADVGIAGAEALGHMGSNGAGGISMGGRSTGFNPAAMMAGMAIGGSVGQNVAGIMNNMMSGMNQQTAPGAVPPPVPAVAYHIAVNGQPTGPFDIPTLKQMAALGQLTKSSLVWKAGMAEWAKAKTVDELKDVLTNVMPPVPPEK